MTAWTIGHNMPGTLPNPDVVHTFRTHADALSTLKAEMICWADDQETECLEMASSDPDETEEQVSTGAAVFRAHVDALFAVDGVFLAHVAGSASASVEDARGHHEVFWIRRASVPMFAYPNDFGPNLAKHDDVMTAEEALEDWISDLEQITDDDRELLFSDTRHDSPAGFNLAAIAHAATYHGIDLDALGYPLPKEL